MPRYWFDICDRDGLLTDQEGEELADLAAARDKAVATVRSILRDEVSVGHLDLRGRIAIFDGARQLLLTLTFGEAVEVRTGPPPLAGLLPGIVGDCG